VKVEHELHTWDFSDRCWESLNKYGWQNERYGKLETTGGQNAEGQNFWNNI